MEHIRELANYESPSTREVSVEVEREVSYRSFADVVLVLWLWLVVLSWDRFMSPAGQQGHGKTGRM